MRFAGILALAVAAVVGASSSAATPPPDLLRTFEPVLLFHGGERWAPEAVESFRADARVEQQTSDGGWREIAARPLPVSNAGCAPRPATGSTSLPAARRRRATADARAHRASGSVPSSTAASCVPPGGGRAGGHCPTEASSSATGSSTSSTTGIRCTSRLWQAHEGRLGERVGRGRRGRAAAARGLQRALLGDGAALERGRETRRDASGGLRRARLARELLHELAELDAVHGVPQVRVRRRDGDADSQLAQGKIVDRTGTAHRLGPAALGGVAPLTVDRARSVSGRHGHASRVAGARASCSGSARRRRRTRRSRRAAARRRRTGRRRRSRRSGSVE